MPKVLIKRGTRAQLNAAAANNELTAGEQYLITDEGVLAVAISASAYVESVMESNLIDSVKAGDGAGSGLDADLLDGQHGAYYLNASNINTGTLAPERLSDSGVPAGTYKSVTVDAKGRVVSGANPTTLAGYGITDALSLDAYGNLVLPKNVLVGNLVNDETIGVEVGNGRTGDGHSYVDLWASATPGNFNARIIREPGENGWLKIINRGTGDAAIVTENYGNISFFTNGGYRGAFGADGNLYLKTPIVNLGYYAGSENVELNLGQSRTSDGDTVIDILSAAASIDYNARIHRKSGVNGILDIRQSGTGEFRLITETGAAIVFITNGVERGRFTETGALNLTTPLPVTSGGTGLNSAGARGNVLVSNGSKLVSKKPYLLHKKANKVLQRYVASAPWLISNTPASADNAWFSVAWSSELGIFAAVSWTGTGNRVMTSEDGITWIVRSTPADNGWHDIVWAAKLGLFVAVAWSGSGNRVMTSPDGVNWTIRNSAADNNWHGVAWSPELGLLVAVADHGSSNRIMTSPDGINWTARVAPANHAWRSVCWSPELGIFAAVAASGTGNRVMTSNDGINWVTRTTPVDNNWCRITWSPELGLFAAVADSGSGNRVMTSHDGITWTARTTPADNGWYGITWAPEIGLFAAVSWSGSSRVMYSHDGINWELGTTPVANAWRGIAWSPELGLFAAVGESGTGNRAMTSVSMYSYQYRA